MLFGNKSAAPGEGQTTRPPEGGVNGESEFSVSSMFSEDGDDLSEAMLTGVDEDEAGKDATASDDGEGKPEDEQEAKAEGEKEGEDEEAESSSESKDDKDESQDKDSAAQKQVPLAALHEARNEIKALRQEVESLKAKPEGRDKPDEPGEPKAPAKVKLSDDLQEEFQELKSLNAELAEFALEDSDDGAYVRRRLESHGPDEALHAAKMLRLERSIAEREQAMKAQEFERQKQEREREISASIDRAYDKLLKAVPELTSDPDYEGKLASFAIDALGMSSEALATLTNPATVVRHGEEDAPLAEVSTDLIAAIDRAYKQAQGVDEKAIREDERKKVTAELQKKMREGDDTAPMLADAPRSESGTEDLDKIPIDKMTPEQERRWLSGV